MSRIVREDNFSTEEREKIAALSKAVGITETTAGILFARGQDTAEKMLRFLNPSKQNFLSPYLLTGMRETVELLRRAKEENWQIAVFGDYDADGIGALAILSRALKEYGLKVSVYVPERREGYGLSFGAVDMMFEDCMPDLIMTVDCGISCAREIAYIQECGAYVIVTDHHELPETLPDCICIDPKIKGEYPYDNLCGAGVAFKVACALIGEHAYELLDFCALSTVADSVTLLGENRDIVAEGLKLIAEKPRPCFTALMGERGEVNSQMLSFTLAPRINAAGRMGDAHAALRLFLSEDEEEIKMLSEKLNAYNEQRQKLCDEVYTKAKQQLLEEGAYSMAIVLCGEHWSAGLIGIVAARLAEEYSRPAVLFVKKNGTLHGSARSIEGVNIYEAIKSCAEWTDDFGGHSQAAGIGVKEENFEPFKRALNEYLEKNYSRADFEPTILVSGILEQGFSRELACEINRLEPFGVGNRRPYFLISGGRLNAQPMKPLSPHVAFSDGTMEYVYFGGARDLALLNSDVKKQLIFECNLSKFRGRESLKGFVRAIVCDDREAKDPTLCAFESTVRTLGKEALQAESLSRDALNQKISEIQKSCAYGLCVVARDHASLEGFPSLENFPREVFYLRDFGVRNTVLLSPLEDCDLSAYREICFLESPALGGLKTGKAHLYANADGLLFEPVKSLDCSHEHMVKLYMYLKSREGVPYPGTLAQAARELSGEFTPEELVFSMAVFEELGLIDLKGERLMIVRGKKTDLMQSKIYSAAQKCKEV